MADWFGTRYYEIGAVAVGGLLLAALGASLKDGARRLFDGFLFGTPRRLARLEHQMSEVRAAGVSVSSAFREMQQRLEAHDKRLNEGEVIMAEIRIYMQQQTERMQEMKLMMHETQRAVMEHLQGHRGGEK